MNIFGQDDLENFGDVGSLEDNVESFLSHDGGDGNIYGSLKQSLNEHKTEAPKGCPICCLMQLLLPKKVRFHALYPFCRYFIWRGWLYTDKK